ncbi:brain-specific angiogenesis inhibitor 1-associated protein 2-like protein 2 isoform X2 [Silurus meridionalis]|uniref:brain-specific angiogenesis inhibitor 1-associated protein 2-like protein 2 isoform X2 n=1 Tax=Silurus meridionalis TaxID=175797 RepID=UPI001EECAAAA|nr:brain-specific angiogenesis inhibitor 1-associated protein 2-like protein 2 isoform X2 [Silurus meridionalis]
MSGANSDQLHRSTLSIYSHLMEQFNPSLQQLVTLGNSYVKAFQALALTSEAYFSALAKMGEQALHTLSSRSLGDVLIQISETQRKLTAEVEGVFHWFHVEVLQALDKNVRLDEEYIGGSRRVYELEVRNQAATLERQLRRGAYRDSLEGSEYMQYLRQSQYEILREEERRYRFLTEKHCGLAQSLFFLLNKTGTSLQQKAEGWKERVNESQSSMSRISAPIEQDTHLRAAVSSLLQPGDRDEAWPGQDHQLGRVPSRAPSPLQTRSRSGSVSESPGVSGGQVVRALVSHPASSNPVLLPFSRGDTLTLLVPEPRNGWMYGRHDASLRQGWFPASYVSPVEDLSSLSSRKAESVYETKASQGYSEIPSLTPPVRMASGDFRPVSPLLDRRAESHFESMTGYAGPERKVEPNVERSKPHRQLPEHPLFPRGSNPFATVKLRPTVTNDRSAPRIH